LRLHCGWWSQMIASKFSMRQLSQLSVEDRRLEALRSWVTSPSIDSHRIESNRLLFNYCNEFYKHCTGLLPSFAFAFAAFWTIAHCLVGPLLLYIENIYFSTSLCRPSSAWFSRRSTCRQITALPISFYLNKLPR